MKQSSYQDLQTCVWPESDRRSPRFRRENSDGVDIRRPLQRRGWPENVEEAFRSCGTRVPMTDSRTEFDRRVSSTGSGCPFEPPCLLGESNEGIDSQSLPFARPHSLRSAKYLELLAIPVCFDASLDPTLSPCVERQRSFRRCGCTTRGFNDRSSGMSSKSQGL